MTYLDEVPNAVTAGSIIPEKNLNGLFLVNMKYNEG
jgi:hypothetical protein